MEERIVERLRKVLALTTSPVEGEAQAAAAMLSKLLADHNLSIADLEKKGAKAKPGVKEKGHDLGKAAFTWKLDLAEAIATHYLCVSLVDRKAKTVAFVGRPDNVESLQMLYGWIIDQIKRLSSEERRRHQDTTGEHVDPLRWQVNFGIGAVERLAVRLHEKAVEEKRRQEAEAPKAAHSMELMIVDRNTETSDYLEEHYGYRVDGLPTKAERESEEYWRKWQEERDAEKNAQNALRISCEKSGDMEPYYAKYPHEHPDEKARRQRDLDRYLEKERKREERNERRRTGPAYRPEKAETPEERRARIQSGAAKLSGREAAKRVNLTPFVEGPKERKRIG